MVNSARINAIRLLVGSLSIAASVSGQAADTTIAKCDQPLKPIGKLGKYMPATSVLPDGTVHVEFTVGVDGLVRDVAIVKSTDERLEAWALVKATDVKFAPREAPCRTQAALRHRNTEHPDGR